MSAPVPDKPACDVPGCGRLAVMATDGTELDPQTDLNRPSLPRINLCGHHRHWSHSTDAESFAATDKYRARVKGA